MGCKPKRLYIALWARRRRKVLISISICKRAANNGKVVYGYGLNWVSYIFLLTKRKLGKPRVRKIGPPFPSDGHHN